MATQKEIAASLDIAAQNAGQYGASKKQVWFLAGLMAKAGETIDNLYGNCPEPLTSRRASAFINDYLKQKAA